MKKILLLLCILLAPSISAQISFPDPHLYHNTFSARVHTIILDKNTYQAGNILQGKAQVENIINHPLVEGKVLILVRYQGENAYDEQIVDKFYIDKEFNLAGGAMDSFNFTWEIPDAAKSGTYKLTFYFYSDDFVVGGANFISGYNIGQKRFEVMNPGKEEFIAFDNENIFVAGKKYDPLWLMDFDREQDDDIKIDVPIINVGSSRADITITYKTYIWSDLKQDSVRAFMQKAMVPAGSSLMDIFTKVEGLTKSQEVILEPGQTKNLVYHLGFLPAHGYSVLIEARNSNTGQKAIEIIRIPVRGKNAYIGVTSFKSFPVKAGETASLLLFYLNPSTSSIQITRVNDTMKIEPINIYDHLLEADLHLELYQDNTLILQDTFNVTVMPSLTLAKYDFIPKEDLKDVLVRVSLEDETGIYDLEETNFIASKLTRARIPRLEASAQSDHSRIPYQVKLTDQEDKAMKGVIKLTLKKDNRIMQEKTDRIIGTATGVFKVSETGTYILTVEEFAAKLTAAPVTIDVSSLEEDKSPVKAEQQKNKEGEGVSGTTNTIKITALLLLVAAALGVMYLLHKRT